MIIGIGIDVVDVERFTASLRRTPRLAERLFTDNEQRLPPASLAAPFAAKESQANAQGAPPRLPRRDAEVDPGEDGRPHLLVSGTVAARAAALGVRRTHLSLSHDAGIASAVVVAED